MEACVILGDKGKYKSVFMGKHEGKDHLEDLDVDLRKIIKKNLRWDGRVDWISEEGRGCMELVGFYLERCSKE